MPALRPRADIPLELAAMTATDPRRALVDRHIESLCRDLKLMKKVQSMTLIVALSVTAACASDVAPSDTHVSDTKLPIVLDCSNGWAKCVSAANKICGSSGFDEIDRVQDTNMTAAGRLDDQSDGRHIYREDVRIEHRNQTMVVRCR